MNIFDKLIDVNEASERYGMTPQAIKQHIGGKILEGIDCKKFGNSWVFVKSSLDIIFRDKLLDAKTPLLDEEKKILQNMGRKLIKDYAKAFGVDKARKFGKTLSENLTKKNDFIHMILEAALDCKTELANGLTYCINENFYPESCYQVMIGIVTGLNENN